ncbi:translation initiation factor IF-3, partial [Candidatus Aerophobetes bacterium]|nr:translation initiation factor IF-3 [Candidatus Aerophobetes bacterium]
KKQSSDTLKEIRLSYQIGEHDLQVKLRKVQEFLKEGHRVKLSIRLRGRENIYKNEGKNLLERIAKEVEEFGRVESGPSVSERKIEEYLVPK